MKIEASLCIGLLAVRRSGAGDCIRAPEAPLQ